MRATWRTAFSKSNSFSKRYWNWDSNKSVITSLGEKSGKCDDDAGHILAKILGGSGGKDNVFPQLKGINRGAYREFESRVRKHIQKYGTVDIEWKFVYGKGGTRPTKIHYDVFQNGKKVLGDIFNN